MTIKQALFIIAQCVGFIAKRCLQLLYGALGCWLVLTERDDNMNIINVKAIKVDGKKIKANIFYTLEDGEIKEEEQQ
nr:MAG TPA: hypothetical protein [Caudoviricetes sp.]